MPLFRAIILGLLVASALCFVLYAGTGQPRWKHTGIVILKWTLIAAFGFFAVLIAERLVA
jgi:high-affinity Fe2+/Pb2+ permease